MKGFSPISFRLKSLLNYFKTNSEPFHKHKRLVVVWFCYGCVMVLQCFWSTPFKDQNCLKSPLSENRIPPTIRTSRLLPAENWFPLVDNSPRHRTFLLPREIPHWEYRRCN